MASILVIGSVNMDAVVEVEHFPRPGQTVTGKSVAFYPGGKGANQCVAAKRFGGDVAMCGMVGKDGNGDTLRRLFVGEGIKDDTIFPSDLPTGMAFIQINGEGENQISVIPSANHAFGIPELDKVDFMLKAAQMVVLQLELRPDMTEEIIRRANAYGVKVLLNPAPAARLSPEVLGMVDYLVPNETELAFLAGMPTESDGQVEAAAKELLRRGVKTVVATLGSRGAMIANGEGVAFVDGFSAKAVDTVAAGDSFCGALAVALTEGKTIKEAVRLANGMGALTVGVKGAIPSLHTREQVEEFLRQHTKI